MKRRAAIFTIQQNETYMLSKWREYYCQHFSVDDMYMLIHSNKIADQPEHSPAAIGSCSPNTYFVYNDKSFDHFWLQRTVCSFQKFLLQSYDTVIFTEIDEFIVPNPDKYSSLLEYINRNDKNWVCCNGYDVVHLKDVESKLKLTQPWLQQRNFYVPTNLYSKLLVAKQPVEWLPGFHEVMATNKHAFLDKDLLLLHFKRIDFDLLYNKNIEASKRNWNEEDIKTNRGFQNRITDLDRFTEWFYSDLVEARVIPENLKGVSGL